MHTDGLAAGTYTVTGCAWVTACANWQVTAVTPIRSVSLAPSTSFVFAQTAATWNLTLRAIQNGAAFSGAPVTWTSTGGLTLGAATTTNGLGQATASVNSSGLALGTVATVTACAWSNVCAIWQVTAVDAGRVAVIANAPIYVAPGAGGNWNVTLTAVQAGAVTPGVAVTWTGSAGLTLLPLSTATDVAGQATVSVSTRGLSAGATATVTGCVWTTTCTSWQIAVVDPSHWHIAVTGGAGQIATASTDLSPVTFAVMDDASHLVQGVPVTLYQTVAAWEGTCPDQGRCAAAPILEATKDNLSTDTSGSLAVTPLRVPGVPQVVNLAAVAGTTGFVAVSVPVMP